jgi:hypothetical protein
MSQFRDLVDEGVALLEGSQPLTGAFRELISRNFEMRDRIFDISERDKEMVAIARRHDAAAKLSGSGGAVIGVPAAEADLDKIASAYGAAGFEMIRPHPVEES